MTPAEVSVPSSPPGYALAAPSEQDLLTALARLLGADAAAAVWREVCAAIGVPRPGPAMPVEQLLVAAELLAQRRPCNVAARSFMVRANSYLMLHEPGRSRA